MENIMDIRISVRSLVEFILRSGNIDNRRAASPENAMQEGGRIHRMIQRRMGPEYQAEVGLRYVYDADGYEIIVEGRADGIITENIIDTDAPLPFVEPEEKAEADAPLLFVEPEEKVDTDAPLSFVEPEKKAEADVHLPFAESEQRQEDRSRTQRMIVTIDEIKGTFHELKKLKGPVPVHLAQAKCYAYIYAEQKKLSKIRVRMTYCHMETEEIRYFHYDFMFEELREWFMDVMQQYRKWADYSFRWQKERQESIRALQFPYPYREGQKELATYVYQTIYHKRKLFIEAPTGVGKTISTVFPAIKAMGEGLCERIFYLTAKTITRTVADNTFALLREHGLKCKSVVLTAKDKICFMDITTESMRLCTTCSSMRTCTAGRR